jgi:hypothetical protein
MHRGTWFAAVALAGAASLLAAPAVGASPAVTAPAVAAPANGAAAGGVMPVNAVMHIDAGYARTAPVDVGTKQIDDLAGAGADTSAARAALDELRAKANIGLFVVLIDSFDGTPVKDWAQSAFQMSNLGNRDMLWVIAPSENRQGYYVSNFPISQATIDGVLQGPLATGKAGDWSGAIVAAANGLADAVGSGGTSSGAGSSSGSLAWLWLVLILAIGVIGFLWLRASKRRKAAEADAKKNAGPPPEPYEQLSARSVTALIQTDNAVQSSDSELQLAEAEFGEQATAEFRAAHDAAKSKLTKAFQLRQEIDDEIPESEDTRRGWMAQIIDLCNQAMNGLTAHTDKFGQLRNLASRLPSVLAALPGQIDAQAARLPQAAATLQRLSGAYSPAALATVSGNPDQANERLEYARTALAEATKHTGDTDHGAAVLAARSAQEAVQQAGTLLDAINRIDTDLGAAATKLAAERDAVVQELAAVSATLKQGSAGGSQDDILHRLAAIQATVNASKTADAARDPLTALKALNDADHALDDILADTRTAQQREARARAALDNELTAAASTISAVDDFISTRRGAVASTARTRLAEAQRHLAAARSLAGTDAKQALAEAQRATELARQAYDEAQNDMNDWTGGGYGRRSSMGGVAGGILGGIVIGSLLGGGRGYGGGWGGGGFGGGGFGGGGGFSGGGGGSF